MDLEVVGFGVEEEDETEEVEFVEFHHCRNSMACKSWHLLILSWVTSWLVAGGREQEEEKKRSVGKLGFVKANISANDNRPGFGVPKLVSLRSKLVTDKDHR